MVDIRFGDVRNRKFTVMVKLATDGIQWLVKIEYGENMFYRDTKDKAITMAKKLVKSRHPSQIKIYNENNKLEKVLDF